MRWGDHDAVAMGFLGLGDVLESSWQEWIFLLSASNLRVRWWWQCWSGGCPLRWGYRRWCWFSAGCLECEEEFIVWRLCCDQWNSLPSQSRLVLKNKRCCLNAQSLLKSWMEDIRASEEGRDPRVLCGCRRTPCAMQWTMVWFLSPQ